MSYPAVNPPVRKLRASAKNIFSFVLRAAICFYLFCQMVVSFVFMMIEAFIILCELHSTQVPPDPPWTGAILFGAVGIGSLILLKRFFARALYGEQRRTVLFAAIMNTTACINPIILIHQVGNTTLGAHITYGFPLVVNTLILGVILSRRLSAYIFPPRKQPKWYKDTF